MAVQGGKGLKHNDSSFKVLGAASNLCFSTLRKCIHLHEFSAGENQSWANHLIQLEEQMLKPTNQPSHEPSNEQMNDHPTTSNNALFLNEKPPSTHQLVVASSVTNIDSQGSTNDGPAYFMQLPVPND